MKIAVFASGSGSNFEAIVKGNISVSLLIVNKSDAYVIKRAKNLGVTYVVIENNKFCEKKEYEKEVVRVLKRYDINYIFLAGYMLLVGEVILKEYNNKIINLHPSLLPKYKGLNAIKQAYDNKDYEVGITYHYIDEAMDEGVIIKQYIIKNEFKSYDLLEEAIHKLEHKTYPKIIKKILEEN